MRLSHTLAVAVLASFISLSAAAAHEFKVGGLTIHHPWTRATPPGAKVAGGYVKIHNAGPTDDTLIGATIEGADRSDIHEMTMEGDVMKMASLPDGLPIPAGTTIELKPGGYHLMFEGLREPLVEGLMVDGTLVFAKAGPVKVEFVVEALGKKESGHDHDQPAAN